MRIRWKGFELPTRVVMETATATREYGKFVAEPFERGFGITVGNGLRRVLLSSIEGVAPVSIRIQGAPHEFTALPGVVEDIIHIAMNAKDMLVKFDGRGSEMLKVAKTGAGPVKAGDFRGGPGVEVVNPGHVLATIAAADVAFEAEIEFRKGRGYIRADDFPWKIDDVIGTIPLDAAFSPVRRARWRVEETRVGKMTDYDRLILEIWTNGVVRPEMALVEASAIFRKHLNPFVMYNEIGEPRPPEAMPEEKPIIVEPEPDVSEAASDSDTLSQPVSILEPSVRAGNCLATENIRTLGDLVSKSEDEMLLLKNFGKTSLKEIKQKLTAMGLSFASKE